MAELAESKIKSILTSTTPVTNVVANRIYGSLPTDPQFPFLVFTRTDTGSYNTLQEAHAFQRAEITISIWADDFPTVFDLANKVLSALNGYRDSTCQGIFLVRQVTIQTDLEPLKAGVNQIWNVYA